MAGLARAAVSETYARSNRSSISRGDRDGPLLATLISNQEDISASMERSQPVPNSGSANSEPSLHSGRECECAGVCLETPGHDIAWKLPVYKTHWHMLRSQMYAGRLCLRQPGFGGVPGETGESNYQ